MSGEDLHSIQMIKGKVDTTTCYEGTEWEWRYSSTLSLTMALSGVRWLTPCLGLFTLENGLVPLV